MDVGVVRLDTRPFYTDTDRCRWKCPTCERLMWKQYMKQETTMEVVIDIVFVI